jgi:hypothetical protein
MVEQRERHGQTVAAWLWSGFNSFGMGLALAILPFVRATPEDVVAASWTVVSIQAAQSAVVQAAGWNRQARRAARWAPLALVVLAVVAACVTGPYRLVAASLAGAVFGLAATIRTGHHLADGQARRYQLAMARRTAVTCVGVAVGLGVARVTGVALAVGLIVTLAVGSVGEPPVRERDGAPDVDVRANALWLAVFGTTASLYYRNDVNWLRSSVAGAGDFTQWHLSLLAYGGLQAVVGIALINHVFARRAEFADLARRLMRGRQVPAVSAVVVGGCLGLLVWTAQGPWVVLPVAGMAAVFVTAVSAVAHTNGWSLLPYLAGCAGVTALLVALHEGAGVSRAFGVEIGIIFGVLLCGVLLLSRRPS